MIGQRVRRREDPRFVTGQGQYVDDLELDGAVWATFVRSEFAHATITEIDTSELPDGAQVFTAADVDLEPDPPMHPAMDSHMARPWLAAGKARFVGEILAIVVTDTPAAGVDAAERVWAEMDPLPAVTDERSAIKNETLLFEDAGTNVAMADGPQAPSADLFDGCEIVVEGELNSQRIHVAPIEPRATAAVWENGRLRIWLSTQTPHQDRDGLAEALGVEPDRVRVISPDVGGGFGGKGLGGEDVLVAWLARTLDRPVRWTETRSEHMVAMGHGRGERMWFTLGGDCQGRFQSLHLRLLQDSGAYPGIGAILPTLTRLMASGVYRIPRIEVRFDSVVTNTSPTAALRGAGRPEASQVLERAVDAFAAEAGLDPAEVRRTNFIGADEFPYTTVVGAAYDIGDYRLVLDTALQTAGYDELRAEQARRREQGDRSPTARVTRRRSRRSPPRSWGSRWSESR